jgi:hypothetical protein
METIQIVLDELMTIPGVTGCWILPNSERNMVLKLEAESNLRACLPGIAVENTGIEEVMQRKHVVAISHSPALRHPPGSVVVLCNGTSIVGEEVGDHSQLARLEEDRNVILLGSSLVLYRDRLIEAKGKPLRFIYRALRFPELEKLAGIDAVASVTVGNNVHRWLTERANWNPNDPNLGTVLIGFNESVRADPFDTHSRRSLRVETGP